MSGRVEGRSPPAPALRGELGIIGVDSVHPTHVDTSMIPNESRHLTALELKVDAGFSIK
jgi:hypothetical protein